MRVVAVAVIGMVAVACSTGQSPPALTIGQPGAHSVLLNAHGTPYGFSVEMTVAFAEDRSLQSAAFQLDGKPYPAELYPDDGTDNEVQPNPLHLAGGVSVMMSAKVVPNCTAAKAPPLLVVRSQTDGGQERDDSFTPSNARNYAAAVHEWCASAVQATIASSEIATTGAVTVKIRLVNPQTSPVTVTSAAYTVGATRWNAASVSVPASGSATLVVTATNGSCSRAHAPWIAGRLAANGKPIAVTQGNEWC